MAEKAAVISDEIRKQVLAEEKARKDALTGKRNAAKETIAKASKAAKLDDVLSSLFKAIADALPDLHASENEKGEALARQVAEFEGKGYTLKLISEKNKGGK